MLVLNSRSSLWQSHRKLKSDPNLSVPMLTIVIKKTLRGTHLWRWKLWHFNPGRSKQTSIRSARSRLKKIAFVLKYDDSLRWPNKIMKIVDRISGFETLRSLQIEISFLYSDIVRSRVIMCGFRRNVIPRIFLKYHFYICGLHFMSISWHAAQTRLSLARSG